MYLARIVRPAAEYSSDAHGALLCSTRRQASSNASSKILISSGWKTSGANSFRNPRTTYGPRAPAAQRAQILCPRGNFEKPIVVHCSKFHSFRVNEKIRGLLRKPLSQPNDCERVPLTALGSSDAASIKLSGGLIRGHARKFGQDRAQFLGALVSLIVGRLIARWCRQAPRTLTTCICLGVRHSASKIAGEPIKTQIALAPSPTAHGLTRRVCRVPGATIIAQMGLCPRPQPRATQ
jgi:hypothetical protein